MIIFSRLLMWVLAVSLVALPVVAVLNGWVGSTRWPLTRLQIIGNLQNVSPQTVRQVVLPYAQMGFFAVPLLEIQHALEALPWIKRAQVSKHWPNRLEVSLEEHQAFARWGSSQILSDDGQLFTLPKGADGLQLPQLNGPEKSMGEVVAFYNQACKLFAPVRLKISHLEEDERGSWSLGLSNGLQIVIGQEAAGLRLQRFAQVLPWLIAHGSMPPIIAADLRYPDGFTLRQEPVVQREHRSVEQEGSMAPNGAKTDRIACKTCLSMDLNLVNFFSNFHHIL